MCARLLLETFRFHLSSLDGCALLLLFQTGSLHPDCLLHGCSTCPPDRFSSAAAARSSSSLPAPSRASLARRSASTNSAATVARPSSSLYVLVRSSSLRTSASSASARTASKVRKRSPGASTKKERSSNQLFPDIFHSASRTTRCHSPFCENRSSKSSY